MEVKFGVASGFWDFLTFSLLVNQLVKVSQRVKPGTVIEYRVEFRPNESVEVIIKMEQDVFENVFVEYNFKKLFEAINAVFPKVSINHPN